MPQVAMQGLGLNYGWPLKDDAWKPGMDADLVLINGLLGNRIQAVVNAEPSVGVAPDASNAGKAWIVGTSPAAWATGKANYIAFRNGETASWIFIPPHVAYGQILNLATGEFMQYRGSAWAVTYIEPYDPLPAASFFLQGLVSTPPTPSSPTDDGKCWAVAVGATGAFAGQDGKLAMWYLPPGGGAAQWKFLQPQKGWRALCDTVPFPDELSIYGYTEYRDFYLHNGTVWELDPLLRLARGPMLVMDFSAAVAGTPYVRVLSHAEAGAGALLISLAAAGTDVTVRYPQSALALVPNSMLAARVYSDPTAKVVVEWGDGTEVAGTVGDAGDPGTGAPAGTGYIRLIESSPEIVLVANPTLGMTPVLAAALERTSSNSEALPSTVVFTAGDYDLSVPVEASYGNLMRDGDVGKLLVTNEATANNIYIRSNPEYFNGLSSDVLLFRIAQKGAGATTIVLDNTATGTNNANDVLDAIASATMAQGESRVLRFVRDGGTGGLGHRWIITQS